MKEESAEETEFIMCIVAGLMWPHAQRLLQREDARLNVIGPLTLLCILMKTNWELQVHIY